MVRAIHWDAHIDVWVGCVPYRHALIALFVSGLLGS